LQISNGVAIYWNGQTIPNLVKLKDMISENSLRHLYEEEKLSMQEIAKRLGFSLNKINYWMKKYGIQSRSISEGVYLKCNPDGDPFKIQIPKSLQDAMLYGLGLGLYWGEGTKSNKHSIRLGNTDPRLVKSFIFFLEKIYGVKRSKLQFGLQVFSDMSPQKALNFWRVALGAEKEQFFKVIVTPSRGKGTYKRKIQHGVLTVYCNNRKLRDILCGEIEKL
jgi:hypothetical protein